MVHSRSPWLLWPFPYYQLQSQRRGHFVQWKNRFITRFMQITGFAATSFLKFSQMFQWLCKMSLDLYMCSQGLLSSNLVTDSRLDALIYWHKVHGSCQCYLSCSSSFQPQKNWSPGSGVELEATLRMGKVIALPSKCQVHWYKRQIGDSPPSPSHCSILTYIPISPCRSHNLENRHSWG